MESVFVAFSLRCCLCVVCTFACAFLNCGFFSSTATRVTIGQACTRSSFSQLYLNININILIYYCNDLDLTGFKKKLITFKVLSNYSQYQCKWKTFIKASPDIGRSSYNGICQSVVVCGAVSVLSGHSKNLAVHIFCLKEEKAE